MLDDDADTAAGLFSSGALLRVARPKSTAVASKAVASVTGVTPSTTRSTRRPSKKPPASPPARPAAVAACGSALSSAAMTRSVSLAIVL